MRTVVVGDRPAELQSLLDRRRAQGLDLFDEVWEGEYHMVPAPGGRHGALQAQLLVALEPIARAAGLYSSGPFNLGPSESNFRVRCSMSRSPT